MLCATRKSCTGQVLPSAKYRPTRVVVDALLRRVERADTAVTKLQMSPLIVNRFRNGFHHWIQRIFLVVVEAKKFFPNNFSCFRNLDALHCPVAGKPLVPKVLCLDIGTSVTSALSAETIFEIMKCVADVDMHGRVRMGSKYELSGFSILATPTIEIFRFLDVGHRE